ncbi:hypothetical protein NX801_27170 [Streptomyces sp. LP05-1]|uniref:Uncharacterized protein n=1 Tax=Streptomyces pyxinae TaxID=2970734 RepID=A0ABT2CPK9_9ACTN|nr:hypothetical protein [Streptomyces sp. LP05-1]MCS0639255.1 hypothetical protein [Streptomyces sp. LP05-1]
METGPAIFAGLAFTLFGAGLLVWTGARTLHRVPVALGTAPAAAATFAVTLGAAFVILGVWCFGRI